jgi:hypothetical protein
LERATSKKTVLGISFNCLKPLQGGPIQTSKRGENGFSELGEMLQISTKDEEWQVLKGNCWYVSLRICPYMYHCWEQSVWHLKAVEITFLKWSTLRLSRCLPHLPPFPSLPQNNKNTWRRLNHASWCSCLAFHFANKSDLLLVWNGSKSKK